MRLLNKALGLLLAMAIVMANTSCSRSGDAKKYNVSQNERDQVLQTENAVLKAEPQLKAEEEGLETKVQEAKSQHGLRSDEYSEAVQEFDTFVREKLRPAAKKINPSSEAIYARMDLDRSNTKSEGFIEFAQEHSLYKFPWRYCIDLTTIVSFVYGLYLLFRPPKIGSANLLLALAFLPSTMLGFAVISDAVGWLESKQSGIYDFPMPTGQALGIFDDLIWTTYEMALPSLFIYIWLLIRLATGSKKTQGKAAEI